MPAPDRGQLPDPPRALHAPAAACLWRRAW